MTPAPNSSKKPHQQETLVVDRYVRLFLDKKILLLGIFLIVTVIWTLIFPEVYRMRQFFTSTAIIRFDEPRISESASGVDERFTQMGAESKIGILSTRSFLTEVIDTLKMNILFEKPRITRHQILKDVKLKKAENFGKYILQKDDNLINVLYTDEDEIDEDVLVKSIVLTDTDIVSIDLSNFKMDIFRNIFDKYSEVEFGYIRTRFVIEYLRDKMMTKLQGARQTMLYISFSSNDAPFGAEITNAIANLFLKQLLDFKRFKTSTVIGSLGEQLQVSKRELEQVESKIRRFREQNPFVTMNEIVAQYSTEMSNDESKIRQFNSYISEVQNLVNDISQEPDDENKLIIYQQLITYLTEQEVPGSIVLRDQYINAMRERSDLIGGNYAVDHPKVIEINATIQELQSKISARARNYISDLQRQNGIVSQNIRKTEAQLRRLPQKEIQLAKLEREREAKSTIYSNILRKYNEAKVADVSITPDAFLLESADVPINKPNIIKILILFLIGPLFGLVIAAGIILLGDIINHKARSTKDIEATLSLPVIANIPIIKSPKEIPEDFDAQKRVDPKLITIDYSPSLASESFRNLRTKLILDKDSHEQRQVIISSLFPGDGKSLVTSNLAVTFAQLKKPTLLMDVDIRRGVQHNSFLCDKAPGLSDILSKNVKLDYNLLSKVIQKTTIPNLFLLSAGKPVPNPTELIIADKFEELVQLLNKHYTYTIFDTPPIEMIPDAMVLNEVVHNLVLTVRYGKSDIGKLKSKLDEFPDLRKDIAGIVFNSSKSSTKKSYYSYSYYKY